ncbi:uncharacterized protein LOC122571446 [Bombus pyrosoma]|uniref:uncharacterized protein LOC122571446 n=1 Tax=Bombus pyrosoma TaxID=396416 RepID=UPI001CB8CA66|nr:uncharacterized protein LOC122571446 [Bombus pyrosoma]
MLQVLVNRLYNMALLSSHPWDQVLSEFVLFQITLSRSRMLVLAFAGAIERAENIKNRPSTGYLVSWIRYCRCFVSPACSASGCHGDWQSSSPTIFEQAPSASVVREALQAADSAQFVNWL